MVPEIRYAKTADGVHIAYQVRGDGPVDLVHVMGFTANFEVELEDPRTARFHERLASLSRLILFDKRGTGLSDRQQTPDLDMRADDLRAVLDAVGSERAVLLGHSEGGALAAFFAATNPHRVSALILWGAAARIAWAPDYPIGMKEEDYLAERVEMANGWGTMEHARRWMEEEAPTLVNDQQAVRWWAKAERHGASPAAALAFFDVWYGTDVRSVLGSVQAPTLALWRPEAGGADRYRYMAEQIPGARPLELPGRDYALVVGSTEEFFQAVDSFLRTVRLEQAEIDRVLATVLFTDIVGSTARAAELGDAAWKDLLERHHRTVRAMIGRYRGREIDTAGDGFFAAFDGPARAVRCAQAVLESVKPMGLKVRAGVHTGEVETIDGKAGGLAVNIGARVAASAAPCELLVSSTVKDLTAGSELQFEDVGHRELKGIPGAWHLFRVVNTAT